jgi:hypothetical protein
MAATAWCARRTAAPRGAGSEAVRVQARRSGCSTSSSSTTSTGMRRASRARWCSRPPAAPRGGRATCAGLNQQASAPASSSRHPGVKVARRVCWCSRAGRATCAGIITSACTAMQKLRIVTVGIFSGGSSLRVGGRFATSADFPHTNCSPYRGLHAHRESSGCVHG